MLPKKIMTLKTSRTYHQLQLDPKFQEVSTIKAIHMTKKRPLQKTMRLNIRKNKGDRKRFRKKKSKPVKKKINNRSPLKA